MNQPTDDELLTSGEVSALLKVPVSTLRTWRNAARGPTSFKLGASTRYRRADLDAWLTEQYNTTRKAPHD